MPDMRFIVDIINRRRNVKWVFHILLLISIFPRKTVLPSFIIGAALALFKCQQAQRKKPPLGEALSNHKKQQLTR
jgi:hypothetical protein